MTTPNTLTTNLLTALTAAVAFSACVISDGDSTFTVDNRSDYALYEVYLADVDAYSWGPDLLRGDILYPGDSLEIHSVDCGTYDSLIYDELGAACELHNI